MRKQARRKASAAPQIIVNVSPMSEKELREAFEVLDALIAMVEPRGWRPRLARFGRDAYNLLRRDTYILLRRGIGLPNLHLRFPLKGPRDPLRHLLPSEVPWWDQLAKQIETRLQGFRRQQQRGTPPWE